MLVPSRPVYHLHELLLLAQCPKGAVEGLIGRCRNIVFDTTKATLAEMWCYNDLGLMVLFLALCLSVCVVCLFVFPCSSVSVCVCVCVCVRPSQFS